MSTTSFEDAARARKVAELYGVARARGYSAAQVATDDALRAELVAAAGVRTPSVDGDGRSRTWELLVGALEQAERHDAKIAARLKRGYRWERNGHTAHLISHPDDEADHFQGRCDCGWIVGITAGTACVAMDFVTDHLDLHAFQTDAEVDIAGAIEDFESSKVVA